MGYQKGETCGGSSARTQTRRTHSSIVSAVVLTSVAFLCGCSAVVSGQNAQPPPPPPQTYSISGTIAPMVGGSGATVALSGAVNATTTADSSGNFTFTGLASGTYTITPSHTGFTFSPSSLAVTINGANVSSGVTFTASALTYSLSGTITPATGGSGATITLSGAATATVTADSSGNYTFTGLSNGSYAVTPGRAGFTFNPTSQNATISGANVAGVNFTAAALAGSFSISGTITPITGGSGATVVLTGPAAATTTTDTSGNYSFSGLANGTYTLTPSNTGYSFSPANQSVTVNGANQTGVNFTATAQQTHTVALSWVASTSPTITGYNVYRSTVNGSGYVKINGSTLVTVLSYTDTTVQNAATYYYVTTAVDSTGTESSYSNQATAVIP